MNVLNIENNIKKWIIKHSYIIGFIIIVLIGFYIRFLFKDFISGDMRLYLMPWYDTIKANGGLSGLNQQVGDYNMLYQQIIAMLTYIEFLSPCSLYKILSCLFDILLSCSIGYIVYCCKNKNLFLGLVSFSCVWLSPICLLNSAVWGQCDVIYTLFAILSLYFLYKESYSVSLIMYGLSFAFKLQTIFILPIFIVAYLKNDKFRFYYFMIIPLVMVVLSIPSLMQGRSVLEVFTIYLNQTGTYKSMYMNYPSFWVLVNGNYEFMSKPAILFTIAIVGLWMLYLLKNKTDSFYTFIYSAFILSYTIVLFLPSMHERYGFIYEILVILMILLKRNKLIWGCMCLLIITLMTYTKYLFGIQINILLLALINLFVYLYFCVNFLKEVNIEND